MPKLTKRQQKIVEILQEMPDKMKPDEFEATICTLISSYIGFEETPSFLLYLHLKTARIQQEMMDSANRGTKH